MGYVRSPTSGKGIIAAYWKGPGMQIVRPTAATKPIMEGSRVIVWPDNSAGCALSDLPGNNWRYKVPRTSEDICGHLDASQSFTLPYRRSVSTGITEIRSQRRFGPEALPSFEDFVASQPLGARAIKLFRSVFPAPGTHNPHPIRQCLHATAFKPTLTYALTAGRQLLRDPPEVVPRPAQSMSCARTKRA